MTFQTVWNAVNLPQLAVNGFYDSTTAAAAQSLMASAPNGCSSWGSTIRIVQPVYYTPYYDVWGGYYDGYGGYFDGYGGSWNHSGGGRGGWNGGGGGRGGWNGGGGGGRDGGGHGGGGGGGHGMHGLGAAAAAPALDSALQALYAVSNMCDGSASNAALITGVQNAYNAAFSGSAVPVTGILDPTTLAAINGYLGSQGASYTLTCVNGQYVQGPAPVDTSGGASTTSWGTYAAALGTMLYEKNKNGAPMMTHAGSGMHRARAHARRR